MLTWIAVSSTSRMRKYYKVLVSQEMMDPSHCALLFMVPSKSVTSETLGEDIVTGGPTRAEN